MAIIIPSKHIHDKKNEKAINNRVDKINAYRFFGEDEKVINNSVHTEVVSMVPQEQGTFPALARDGNGYLVAEIAPYYYNNVRIEIPVSKPTKMIENIKTGTDASGVPNISVSVYGYLEEGSLTAVAETQTVGETTTIRFNINTNSLDPDQQISQLQEQVLSLPTEAKNPKETSSQYSPQAVASFVDQSNNKTARAILENDKYVVTLKILTGVLITRYSGSAVPANGDAVYGRYEFYRPSRVEVSFLGDTTELQLTDVAVPVGEGNSFPKDFVGCELNQIENYQKEAQSFSYAVSFSSADKRKTITADFDDEIFSPKVEEYSYVSSTFDKVDITQFAFISSTPNHYEVICERPPEQIAGNVEARLVVSFFRKQIGIENFAAEGILTQYANGKETATILCSVSDYYNQNGEKEISISGQKMTFAVGDEVIPQNFSVGGQDVPMSKKTDGSPKTFVVVGVKNYFDGAVWQELHLQEVL